MTTQTDFENKPEIKALPEAVQRKLVSFIYTEIPKMPFFKPDGKPKKEWKIFYGDTWGAARDAARDAAYDAAYGAASGAAYGAAYDAAYDAALCARYILTSDLKFKDKAKHLKHVLARWEVWQKGYGLLCDVNGVLYVYTVKPQSPESDKDKIAVLEKQVAALQGKIENVKKAIE